MFQWLLWCLYRLQHLCCLFVGGGGVHVAYVAFLLTARVALPTRVEVSLPTSE
jgi:hypothetical protein